MATFAACGERYAARGATRPVAAASAVPEQAPALEQQCTARVCWERDGFYYAKQLDEVAMAEPPRFAAPLPASLAELAKPDAFPPLGQVSAAICAGDEAARAKYLDALHRATTTGALSAELREHFDNLPRYCAEASYCRWLVDAVSSERAPQAKSVLFTHAARCGRLALDALEAPDSPDEAVIDAYLGMWNGRLPFSPRLRLAITRQAQKLRGRDLRSAGVVMVRVADPGAVAFIDALQGKLDPASAAWLSLGMGEQPGERARQLFQQACRHPEVEEDLMCTRNSAAPEAPADSSLQAQVTQFGFDAGEWLLQHPERRAELLAILEHGVSGSGELGPAKCLGELATLDWPKARTAITKLTKQQLRAMRFSGELLAALRSFATLEAFVSYLQKSALLPASFVPELSTLDGGPDASTLMRQAGRSVCFDAETDRFPNEHDSLLSELARATSPELVDVKFAEVPPVGATEDSPGRYLLQAYSRGRLYTLPAENLGDWYDLEAVLGLINQVSRKRSSNYRFATLKSGDQFACIVTGPGEAIAAAAKQGLLEVESPSLESNPHAVEDLVRAVDALEKSTP